MQRLDDPWEMTVYRQLYRAAQFDQPCPTTDDLAEMLDCSGMTIHNIFRRLERRGLIKRTRYQRSRSVYVVETGQNTAHRGSLRPHWRLIQRDLAKA